MTKKFITASFVTKDTTANTFTAVASTATVDRHGEVVSPDGWNLENFKKNPVLLWSHDHTIPAIGKATKVWVEGYGVNAKLMFSGIWQTVTEEGKAAAQLVADGILNSFSVGFIPFDMQGNTYTEQELLEISLVNVPANPDAMMLAYKSLRDNGFDEKVAKNTIQQFASMGAVRKDLFGKERGALQDELDAEAEWDIKREKMSELYEIFWAFCDVYYDEKTPSSDFDGLLKEYIAILGTVLDGTFEGGGDGESEDVVEDTINDDKVIDKHKQPIKTVDNTAKVTPIAPKAPIDKELRTKQSIAKAIVKATDQLLADEKKGSSQSERVKLMKIIKRGGEILIESNKGKLQ